MECSKLSYMILSKLYAAIPHAETKLPYRIMQCTNESTYMTHRRLIIVSVIALKLKM